MAQLNPRRLWQWPGGLLTGGTLILGLMTFLSALGPLHWLCDIPKQFTFQFLILSVVVLWAWAWARSKTGFFLTAVMLALWAGMAWPEWAMQSQGVRCPMLQGNSYQVVRVLHYNVWYINPTPEAALRFIKSQKNAHLLAISEASPSWYVRFREDPYFRAQYPYWSYDRTGEMLAMSQYPLENLKAPSKIPRRSLWFRLRFPGKTSLYVAVLHAPSPVLPRWASEYWPFYHEMMDWVPQLPKPYVLVGDMNTTPWSTAYQQLFQRVPNLVDSRWGRGLQLSWPSFFPPASVSIDHLWSSEDVAVIQRRTYPAFGSDHHPVFADLAIPKGNGR